MRLMVVEGPDRGRELELVEPGGALGRADDCAIRLGDPAVSRHHCRVVVHGATARLVDDASTNRTLVNDAPVREVELRPGDRIAVGRTVLVVAGAAPAVAPRPAAIELATVELVTRAGGADDLPAVLARLGDALQRATDVAAAATAACQAVATALGAAAVTLVRRRADGDLDAIAATGAATGAADGRADGAADTTPGIDPRAAIDRGVAAAYVLADRHVLVAPLAPADATARVRGALIATRAAAWRRRDLELASALARLVGAGLDAQVARDRLDRANRSLAERLGGAVIADSDASRQLATLIARVGPTDTTVLITGESGVGKELVAEAVHAASPRARGPFVAVNCAALSEGLLESELFGHEKGAFTGAAARRAGRLEQADGGTLFLDEVGELGDAAQAKLLRALEARRFERVGGAHTVAVDLRLIAATNRDLEAMVHAGRFRRDLYYRLCVVRLAIAPLRERRADVAPLARLFVARFGAATGRPRTLDDDALAALEAHDWPGNVRELRNVIERAIALGAGPTITAADVEPLGALAAVAPATGDAPPRSLRELEQEAVAGAMKAARGNKARAAQLLGIDRTTLYKKLKQLGLG
ncbi:MAG: sigma 54-dependent Fis family transcriptional regulator [Kofleriaceae bacterium]|nr:sigma 54-dependent Fis family transcriptional regulator [Kofleriaceae bacterium]